MTIQTTRYSPDTCDCVIDYNWDDSLPLANRVHTLSTFIKVCSAHQSLGNDTARWNAVFDENPRKNQGLQHILDNSPTNALYDIAANGQRQLKPALGLVVSFSGTAPDRVLTLSFTGITLTQTQKNTIQSALNTRFGAGKVLIA